MPALVAYEKEFKRGFKENLQAANVLSAGANVRPGLLVLFYAIECGLKYLLCVRRRGSYLSGGDQLSMTHNLADLVKELRFPSGYLPNNFRLQRDATECCPAKECHLAWRYGVGVNGDDEIALSAGLTKLAARIMEDM